MLTKLPLVTYTPAVASRAAQAASHTCFTYPPAGSGGSTAPPPPLPPVVIDPTIPAGTPIWLAPHVGNGYAGVYPAPAGYTCYRSVTYIITPGSFEPAAVYYVTCTQD